MIELSEKHKQLEASMAKRDEECKQLEEKLAALTQEKADMEKRYQSEISFSKESLEKELNEVK